MGYGKFEYTREGVNHAHGIYPMNIAGRAITFLNSLSNSEIPRSPSPHEVSLTSYLTLAEGVMQYGNSPLCARALGPSCSGLGVPPSIWFVACATLEHPIADPCDVAGNSVACVVFGYSLSQEMIVILTERIVPVQSSKGSCLVDRFQDPAVPWFAPAVTVSATQLLMFGQPAVTQVLSAIGESPSIHHSGYDLHRSNGADAVNLSLEAHQFVTASKLFKASLVLLFAAPVEINVLLEDPANEGGALPFVSVAQCERLLLVQDPNTRANNIFVATDQKPQLIQCAVAMIDLLQKSGPQQFTEFPCIDLIGLRAMKE